MNFIDLEKGDKVQTARVVKRYINSHGIHTAVLEVPRHRDEQTLINEMAQMGWAMDFKRDSVDKMWFRKADEWDIESGTGNS